MRASWWGPGLSRGWMRVGQVDGLRSSGLVWVTEGSGSPRSRSLCSSPCSAAWSATGPRRTVVSSVVWERSRPSSHVDQRSSSLPWMRISYQSPWGPVRCSAHGPQARNAGDERASAQVMSVRLACRGATRTGGGSGPRASSAGLPARGPGCHCGKRWRVVTEPIRHLGASLRLSRTCDGSAQREEDRSAASFKRSSVTCIVSLLRA